MAPKPRFATAPKPPALTAEQAAFIDKGRGKDKTAAAPAVAKDEPTHRLSLDVPKRSFARFKAACALADTKMTPEILAFIERRTAELEKSGNQ